MTTNPSTPFNCPNCDASYRFSLLTRITLKDGEETDLWSARDALVLKALALVLGSYLPVSRRCTHIKRHGGAKYRNAHTSELAE